MWICAHTVCTHDNFVLTFYFGDEIVWCWRAQVLVSARPGFEFWLCPFSSSVTLGTLLNLCLRLRFLAGRIMPQAACLL